MKGISLLLTVVAQILAAWLLGFGVAFGFGIGNGWELAVIPLGNAVGVWAVGLMAANLRRESPAGWQLDCFMLSLVGAGAGSLLILITPPIGFVALFFPLIGSLAGYYLARRWTQGVQAQS